MNANGEIIIFNVLAQILLLLTLITAAVTDLRDRKVYNWLTFPAMIFGLTLAWADGGIGLFFDHLLRGFLPAVLIFGLFWWMGGLQGGDMKLMAAIGAIKGYPFIITSMFWTGIAGAILALGKLAWEGVLLRGLWQSTRYFFSLRPPDPEQDPLLKQSVPYGIAIAVGTLFNWYLTEIKGIQL